jgi:hypothetical protein
MWKRKKLKTKNRVQGAVEILLHENSCFWKSNFSKASL